MKHYVLFGTCILLALSCKKEPPNIQPLPPYQQTIHLSIEDISCTEAWLKVSLTDMNEPRTVAITQDGQRKVTARIATLDSVFMVEYLLPNRTYRFAAQRMRDTTVTDTCGTVLATTLDSTSHNFSWEIDTLGDGNSSVLNDASIVNDTLAYAVGELYVRDSTGQIEPLPHNLAVWNGRRWDIRKLNYRGIPPAIRFIFNISERDIWFDPWFRWNGHQFVEVTIDPLFYGISWNKMWGSPNGNLYIVGDYGNILQSADNGLSWQRMVSGTTLPINDIWGVQDSRSGATEIYAVASRNDQNEGRRILKIGSSSVTAMPDSGTSWSLRGIWFTQRGPYYVVGAGVHYKRDILSSTPWNHYPPGEVTNYFSEAIRGSARNDVVVVGDFGEIVHFNGVTWRNYLSQTRINGTYYGVRIKGNLIIAVGQVQNRGVVAVGRR